MDWSESFPFILLFALTANLSTEAYSDLLSEHPSGVYFGWAGLATRGIYKMVMSIGWNPYFNNSEKTIVSQAHLAVLTCFYQFLLPLALWLKCALIHEIITGAVVAS